MVLRSSYFAFLCLMVFFALIEAGMCFAESGGVIRLKNDGTIEPLGAHVERVDNVTYRLTSDVTDSIILEKDDLVFDGFGFTVKGSEGRDGILLVGRTNITVKNIGIESFSAGLHIFNSSGIQVLESASTNNTWGIKLESCWSSVILGNNFVSNTFGVVFDSSNNNTLLENNVSRNVLHGIYFFNSNFCTVTRNNITENQRGIYFDSCSDNNISRNSLIGNSYKVARLGYCNRTVIAGNLMVNSLYGFWLYGSSNNTVVGNVMTSNHYEGLYLFQSSENVIVSNSLEANGQIGLQLLDFSNSNKIACNDLNENSQTGAYIQNCSDNQFYHNNFVNNSESARVEKSGLNSWDDGKEGNYWSEYLGIDNNHNGIGDSAMAIDGFNIDRYPLMGSFQNFPVDLYSSVAVVSNSTVERFEYSEQERKITLYIQNSSSSQSSGFCRICFQRSLVEADFGVIIDDGQTPVLNQNYSLDENETHVWIYFEYGPLSHKIIVVPEYASYAALALFLFSTLLSFAGRRKARNRRSRS